MAAPDPDQCDPTGREAAAVFEDGVQVIPRPPDVRPGEPAPWAGLPLAVRQGIGVDVVLGALTRAGLDDLDGPPGEPSLDHPYFAALATEAPAEARTAASNGLSAVLIALFEEDGEARVVLTRRSADLRFHAGQVSFPGGRVDPGEEAPAAALREASEEVGLDPGSVTLAGRLHPIVARGSTSLVLPVVGVLDHRPTLVANPAEVARIFDVSLAELAADGVFREERWVVNASRDGIIDPARPPIEFPVWFFMAGGETIWGATGRVLHELLSLVLGEKSAFRGPGFGG